MSYRWKLCVLINLFIAKATVDCACTWDDAGSKGKYSYCYQYRDNNVIFVANCTNTIELQTDSQCYDGGYYYAKGHSYQSLIIKVTEPTDSKLIFSEMSQYSYKFLKVTLDKGNLTTIPDDIYNLQTVLEIEMLNNPITTVNLTKFLAMSNYYLRKITLSNNRISKLQSDHVSDVVSPVESLDLSNNLIEDLPNKFLKKFSNLQHLNLAHNKIHRTNVFSFDGLESLQTLDISFNKIKKIKSVFSALSNLRELLMSNNELEMLQEHNFVTLTSLEKIDVSHNKICELEDETFQSLNKLKILNIGHNEIETLDFLHKDIVSLPNITEISVDYNKIVKVSSDDIFHFNSLQKLNLAGNDLTSFNTSVYTTSSNLSYINLSGNSKMEFTDNSFNNEKHLNQLSMQKITLNVAFKFLVASIEIVEAQSCGIIDLNTINFFNIKNISTLNLSRNDIKYIDINSFKEMPSLVNLDLSFNNISFIQPGSFLHIKNLTSINLSGNVLSSIMFGVFDGPKSLKFVNVSSNMLQSFDVNMLPAIEKLYLDDNTIRNLNFRSLFRTNISELSIGGNQILCEVLAGIKVSNDSELFENKVTAKSLVFSSENVNGISCSNSIEAVATGAEPACKDGVLMTLLKPAVEKIIKNEKSLQVLEDTNKKYRDEYVEKITKNSVLLEKIKNSFNLVKENNAILKNITTFSAFSVGSSSSEILYLDSIAKNP